MEEIKLPDAAAARLDCCEGPECAAASQTGGLGWGGVGWGGRGRWGGVGVHLE